jgi:hypothetical protein
MVAGVGRIAAVLAIVIVSTGALAQVIPPSAQPGRERERFTQPPAPRAQPGGPTVSLPSTVAPTGQSTSAGGTGQTTAQLKSGLPSGFDPTVWGSSPSINSSYPYLLWQVAGSSPSSPTILTPTTAPNLIPITVTANSLSIVYGSPDPALSYQITSGSLSGSTSFSGLLTRVPGQNVGTYAITLGTLTLPSMYTLTYVGGTLTITPASLTITAGSTYRQVGTVNPMFDASYSGFVAGDGPPVVSGVTFSTPATTNSPAGTYSIVPGGASALNYKISYINGTLTLTSAPTPTPTPPEPPKKP